MSLDKYRIGPGGAEAFGEVMDESAPFVQPEDGLSSHNPIWPFDPVTLNVPPGPIQELIQVSVAYSKLNPNDLSHMLERIRLTKKMAEIVPTLQKEAEEGREAILAELGIITPKPVKRVKKPTTTKEVS